MRYFINFIHNHPLTNYVPILFAVSIITAIGILLRLHNVSPFNIYPDSYQDLLVAKNIASNHSVFGYLGKNGMVFPQEIMWTRPTYPLLILIAEYFTHNLTVSAHLVGFLFAIFTIPLTFLMLEVLFKKSFIAICGAVLVALSGNHTIWSGFIMTETTGVFVMTMLLFFLFYNTYQNKHSLSIDCIIGILFGVAIMTRYEYLVVVIPMTLLVCYDNFHPLSRLMTICSALFFTLAFFVTFLFPINYLMTSIISKVQNELITIVFILTCVCVIFIAKVFIPYAWWKHSDTILRFCLWSFVLLLILQTVFPGFLFSTDFTFIRNFFLRDFLICCTALVGLSFLLVNKKHKKIAYFVLLAVFCLVSLYHHINPTMERYMTHLIPFLIIPGSWGLATIMTKGVSFVKKKNLLIGVIFLTLVFGFVVFQAYSSYYGLRYLRDNSWYQINYQEEIAQRLKQINQDHNTLLIVSFPEPYYYITKYSTYSVADVAPYIFIGKNVNAKKVIIVLDAGMKELFPNFTKFLLTCMQKEKIAEYKVNTRYHYTDQSKQESIPIIIYATTLTQLKQKINYGKKPY